MARKNPPEGTWEHSGLSRASFRLGSSGMERIRIWCEKRKPPGHQPGQELTWQHRIRVWFDDEGDSNNVVIEMDRIDLREAQRLGLERLRDGPPEEPEPDKLPDQTEGRFRRAGKEPPKVVTTIPVTYDLDKQVIETLKKKLPPKED